MTCEEPENFWFLPGVSLYQDTNQKVERLQLAQFAQPLPAGSNTSTRGPQRFRITSMAPGIKWKSLAKSIILESGIMQTYIIIPVNLVHARKILSREM